MGKKWKTTKGFLLLEKEAEGTRFYSVQDQEGLHMLDSAYAYQLIDPTSDEILMNYRGQQKYGGIRGDFYITRYHVQEQQLLRFEFRYWEEETLGIPNFRLQDRTVLESDLQVWED